MHQPQEPDMPEIPAEKIIALIADIRAFGRTRLGLEIADVLQKMVDDEVAAVDAYYEKMAQEAYEVEDGRRVMDDAAIEKALRYVTAI